MTVLEVPVNLVLETMIESADDVLPVGVEMTRNASMVLELKAEKAINLDGRDRREVSCVDNLMDLSNSRAIRLQKLSYAQRASVTKFASRSRIP